MTKLCFDYDPLLYTAGSVGEERTIKVVHRVSGDEYEFANRTAFWGHWKKRAGGWLAEYNAAKSEGNRRHPDEFEIVDVQTPEPIENCIHTLKQMITGVKEAVGASMYYGYTGRGKVFREDVSTVVKYKGNREGALRPVHLDDLKEYLIKHHGCKVIETIEADDACSIDSYDAWKVWSKTQSDSDKLVLAYTDKDYLQCAAHLYHTDSGTYSSYGEGFGWLAWDEVKKKVSGRGRMWLYFQVMNGDDADNYFANSGNPAMRWADKSAFDILKDAKNDKEAFEALVKGYKLIYPTPKTIVGWRGYKDQKNLKDLVEDHEEHEIEIDWLYMLQENFTLAKMLRWKGDTTDVKAVMDKLGVQYAG